METTAPNLPALVVIDAQKGIDEPGYWGVNRNNPEAETNIDRLMAVWTEKKLPIVVVRHLSVSPQSPFYRGKLGTDLKDFVTHYTPQISMEKSTANAFINTSLASDLRTLKISSLFITGFITNNSVEATARMAGELGFNTCVVSDATATFTREGIDGEIYSSELIHQISLANLNSGYATIKTTRQVIDEIILTE